MKKTIKTESPVEYIVWTALVVLVVVGVYAFRNLIFNNNIDEVVPGKVYRSAQMTSHRLRETTRRLGIKTVINLRGQKDEAWYREEKKVCEEEGVLLEDVGFSGRKYPGASQLTRLLAALSRHDNEPVLIHCRQGTDRSGLASAFVMIIRGHPPDKVLEEFSLRHGSFGTGFNRKMRSVIESYLAWAEQKGEEPGEESLRNWINNAYQDFLNNAGGPGGN